MKNEGLLAAVVGIFALLAYLFFKKQPNAGWTEIPAYVTEAGQVVYQNQSMDVTAPMPAGPQTVSSDISGWQIPYTQYYSPTQNVTDVAS